DFEDAPFQANWALNEISNAYEDLGDEEAARAVLAAAAIQEEEGQADNVSQLLNSAVDLVFDGRPEDGLHRVEAVAPNQVSPYGWSVVVQARACAAAQLKDAEALDFNLRILEEMREEGPSTETAALVCADRMDDAAAQMIWRLENERTRVDALLDMQDF